MPVIVRLVAILPFQNKFRQEQMNKSEGKAITQPSQNSLFIARASKIIETKGIKALPSRSAT